jgi:hypothetical protein
MSLHYLRKHSLSLIKLALLFSGFAAASLTAFAQTSQVSGQVVDASHAVVAGADLTLTRVETGDTRQQHSTSEGYYSFPLLLPGHYDLKVERDGYETQDQKGIIVETGTVSTVNVVLAVGAVAQTVEVDTTVPLLQSQSSAVEDVVENQTIVNMPLIDRRSSQLQRLEAAGEITPITWLMAGTCRISCSACQRLCLTHLSNRCRNLTSPSAIMRQS